MSDRKEPLSPTPEMIEAAARAICSVYGADPDEVFYCVATDDNPEGTRPLWTDFVEEARLAIKAALAAMWVPFPEQIPSTQDGLIVKTRDGIIMSDQHTIDDGWMIADDDDVVAFIPLSIFEDRKQ